jgi:ferric-dicitrate binding protein FerR (iron transport regulator)
MNKIFLIDRVLSGNASETERMELEEWISQSEANKIEYQDIKLLWENSREENMADHDDHFYDGLRNIKASIQQKHKSHSRTAPLIITIVTITSFAVAYVFFNNQTNQESQIIRFDNAPLESVIPVLEERYNIHIVVNNKEILACRFTGTFFQADSVHDVIRSLSSSMALTYEFFDNQEYILTGKGCISNHP